ARIASNALPAQTTLPWGLSTGDQSTWIIGTSNNLNPGDGILFVSSALQDSLTSGSADFHIITKVVVDSIAKKTQVTWDQPLGDWLGQNNPGVYVHVFRKRAALFGVQAPPPWTLASLKIPSLPTYPNDWAFQFAGSSQINLDASYPAVSQSQPGEPRWIVLSAPELTALFQVTATAETGPMLYALTSKTTQLTLANGQVLVNQLELPAMAAQVVAALEKAISTYVIDLTLSRLTTQDVVNLDQAINKYFLSLGFVTTDLMLSYLVSQTRNATAFIQSEPLTPVVPP